jgi:hypothetical protein
MELKQMQLEPICKLKEIKQKGVLIQLPTKCSCNNESGLFIETEYGGLVMCNFCKLLYEVVA